MVMVMKGIWPEDDDSKPTTLRRIQDAIAACQQEAEADAGRRFRDLLINSEVDLDQLLVHEDGALDYFKNKIVAKFGLDAEPVLIVAVDWGDYMDSCIDGVEEIYYFADGDTVTDHTLTGNWFLVS